MRDLFIRNGLIGFQWLSGSFVEEVETLRGRPPKDVDVVTFFAPPAGIDRAGLWTTIAPTVGDHGKLNFKVDHQIIPLDIHPAAIVDGARFWYALFAHTRMREWKGLVRVSLDSSAGDAAARASLGART